MPHDLLLTPQLDHQRAAQLTRLAKRLDEQLDHPTGVPQPVAQSGLLEQLGTLLWEATRLEADAVRVALDEARDAERPLRLVVQGEQAQHLPWELLYHVHPDLGFVAQHPWCVVTRRLRGTGERQPRRIPRPLRLLLFIAAPEDLDPERSRLDFEREEELLFTALDRPLVRGEVEIDVAEDGVLTTLLTRLEEQRYHAMILSMHGTPARNSQGTEEWGLLFEDAHTGRRASVAGSDLATQLDRLPRGHRPGLIILAACRSARAAESAEPLRSVAETLHIMGFERVLGMRLSVLDGAASAFDAELFRRLALGRRGRARSDTGTAGGGAGHMVARPGAA
jgi:CHAT domain